MVGVGMRVRVFVYMLPGAVIDGLQQQSSAGGRPKPMDLERSLHWAAHMRQRSRENPSSRAFRTVVAASLRPTVDRRMSSALRRARAAGRPSPDLTACALGSQVMARLPQGLARRLYLPSQVPR